GTIASRAWAMTDVKICGLTRPEDVRLACDLGAGYVGFNFSAVSARRVSIENARRLADATTPGVLRVGVFVEEGVSAIDAAIAAARLDLLQIHRPLLEADLDRLPLPVIAVACVARQGSQLPSDGVLARCRSLLFDTALPEHSGGTGVVFDWSVLERRSWPVPVFLAGGLNSGNVREAIARLRPSAVDVASGVESAPGIKDERRMKEFFEAVGKADAS
ncbi:MAG TPA: phosphoribosylanthranilate isomerase, partial [Thermoanaerobaculia bacterium]|nr:phosphoribosylanthranilate isomerase [Thermoanaerobaculia bacterium]